MSEKMKKCIFGSGPDCLQKHSSKLITDTKALGAPLLTVFPTAQKMNSASSESDIASEDDDWEPEAALSASKSASKKRKRTSLDGGGGAGRGARGRGRGSGTGRGRGAKATGKHAIPNFTNDEVLAHVRELSRAMISTAAPTRTVADLGWIEA